MQRLLYTLSMRSNVFSVLRNQESLYDNCADGKSLPSIYRGSHDPSRASLICSILMCADESYYPQRYNRLRQSITLATHA